ncbi:hypothetical protein HDV00_009175 [Rhizophlyctis rosea]|nr:hypothetical protein HDV00_009175 [Rhizophlyctis rosea]
MMGQAKPMTTQCVYAELRKLGSDYTGAALNAKRFEKRRCTHQPAIAAADCLREIIGETNKFNYCVATQDTGLRAQLRNIPGTPLIYINKGVTILEPPSHATLDAIKQMEVAKTKPQSFEVSVLKKPEPQEEPVRKKKKVKGPNPLSVKKKKEEPKPKKPKEKKAGKEDGKGPGARAASAGEETGVVDGSHDSGVQLGDDEPIAGKKRQREEEDDEEGQAITRETPSGDPNTEAGSSQKKKRKRRKKTKAKPGPSNDDVSSDEANE